MRFSRLVLSKRIKKSAIKNFNRLIFFEDGHAEYNVTPSFKLSVAANGYIEIQHKENTIQTRFESCLLRDIIKQLNLNDWTDVTIRNVKATKTEILMYDAQQQQWLCSTKSEGFI